MPTTFRLSLTQADALIAQSRHLSDRAPEWQQCLDAVGAGQEHRPPRQEPRTCPRIRGGSARLVPLQVGRGLDGHSRSDTRLGCGVSVRRMRVRLPQRLHELLVPANLRRAQELQRLGEAGVAEDKVCLLRRILIGLAGAEGLQRVSRVL